MSSKFNSNVSENEENLKRKYAAYQLFIDKVLELDGRPNYSSLRGFKLLFLMIVSSSDGKDLLDIFDKFYALPNGPVESDVYNKYLNDRPSSAIYELDENTRNLIGKNVGAIMKKSVDGNLIKAMENSQLIEISHRYPSWIRAYGQARVKEKHAHPMLPNYIIQDIDFNSEHKIIV